MKKIELHGKWGDGRFTLVSDEDYDYLNQFRWHLMRDNKNPHIMYAARYSKNPNRTYMHREIIGDKPGFLVDHINRNTLDNRRENLRHLTPFESNENRRNSVIGGNGHGYVKNGNKFRSQCKFNGKMVYLGMFENKEEAHMACVKFKKENHNYAPQ